MTNFASAQAIADRAESYGVSTQGEVVGPEYHAGVDYADIMTLKELAAAGGHISRVRILASKDWGFWAGDISYIHGEIDAPCPTCNNSRARLQMGCSTCQSRGTFRKTVPLRVDFNSMGVRMNKMKGALIEWAKEEKVFAKGLGLLDEGNWSILWG